MKRQDIIMLNDRLSKLLNYAYSWIVSRGNFIVMNGWVNIKYGKIRKRNFGDELNYYILKELTGKEIVGYYDIPHLFKHEDLLFIGSIIEDFTTSNSIIWGSGAISGKKAIVAKPKQVCAVRGKLTRKYLMEQGVDCPEVYGDPALLLPFIYKPSSRKQYKVGFIPHVDDLDNPNVLRLQSDKSIHLIEFNKYGEWKKVIDEINSCEFIISSSLHGLIIADAYRIPNLWVRFSENIIGGDFKYLDYFSGVNRPTHNPYYIQDDTCLDDLKDNKDIFNGTISFDVNKFLSVAPFDLNNRV